MLLDASASTDPSSTAGTNDDIVRFEWFEDLGGADEQFLGAGETLTIPFTLGRHEVALRVTDSLGTTDEDPVTVTVMDTLPASLLVSTDPSVLWPANRNLVPIRATVSAVDACGGASVVLASVTSSEPDDGGGDGNTEGDIQGADLGTPDFEFALRAERSGLEPGRRYEVTYSATDASGNQARVTQFVSVLHDRGNDRDGDGIGDDDEVSLGTSPDDGDSDDDGFADDLELARGTDPLAPASIAASPVPVPALGGAAVALLLGSLTLIGAVMLRGRR